MNYFEISITCRIENGTMIGEVTWKTDPHAAAPAGSTRIDVNGFAPTPGNIIKKFSAFANSLQSANAQPPQSVPGVEESAHKKE